MTAILYTTLFCVIGPIVLVKNFFTKKHNLSEQINRAFPLCDQEYALNFFKKYLGNRYYPLIELYRKSITNREEFYERAAFVLCSMPVESEKGWIIAESHLRFEWEIVLNKATNEILLQKENLAFPIANSFSDFIQNIHLVENLPTDFSYPELDNNKKSLLKTVFEESDWTTVNEIYKVLSSSSDEHVCDLLNDKAPFFTKNSYYYRGCFNFHYPERRCLQYGNWWIIGQGAENEDTGPDEGIVLVDCVSGNIAYCVSDRIVDMDLEPDQESHDTCFLLAENFQDFIDKLKLRGWTIDSVDK